MSELVATWVSFTPFVSAFLLLICGLSVGSFCSVLRHRLPLGKSIVAPRSHCPHCLHPLGPFDLIPVISYLWRRGRCRYCGAQVGLQYLVLEVSCALTGMAAGALWGVGVGLLALALWAAGTAWWAVRQRSLHRRQAGFTLVEVLVSLLLLTMVLSSVYEAINMTRRSTKDAERRTQAVNLARECLARVAGAVYSSGLPQDPGCSRGELNAAVSIEDRGENAWLVTVEITCPACRQGLGTASHVRLDGVVRL